MQRNIGPISGAHGALWGVLRAENRGIDAIGLAHSTVYTLDVDNDGRVAPSGA